MTTSSRTLLITTILLGGIHSAGTYFDYYGILTHYDTFAHFLGGVWVASIFYFLSITRPSFNFLGEKKWINIILLVALVALIGVLWEFFEYITYYAIAHFPQQPALFEDTLTDLLADMFGAFAIGLFLLKKVNK